jgi:iron complex transport system substrate-binding protein
MSSEKTIRVISLLPSATELIHSVLEEAQRQAGDIPINVELVGRSHECDWPELYSNLPMLTASKIKSTTSEDIDRQVREQLAAGNGLYSVDKDVLIKLKPDVIVTQSLCKVCSVDYCLVEDITSGMSPKPILVDTNPQNVSEVLRDLRRVAAALGLKTAGDAAVAKLEQRIINAMTLAVDAKKEKNIDTDTKVGFLEWTVPIFCGGHWTPQIIEMAGASHPLNPCKCDTIGTTNDTSDLLKGGNDIGFSEDDTLMSSKGRSRGAGPSFTVPQEDFVALDPDVIVVACCGFDIPRTKQEMKPALTENAWWKELRAVKEGRVWVVDGNQMFNRPGPRLVDALEWLVSMLYGMSEVCPVGFPAEKWVQ